LQGRFLTLCGRKFWTCHLEQLNKLCMPLGKRKFARFVSLRHADHDLNTRRTVENVVIRLME